MPGCHLAKGCTTGSRGAEMTLGDLGELRRVRVGWEADLAVTHLSLLGHQPDCLRQSSLDWRAS